MLHVIDISEEAVRIGPYLLLARNKSKWLSTWLLTIAELLNAFKDPKNVMVYRDGVLQRIVHCSASADAIRGARAVAWLLVIGDDCVSRWRVTWDEDKTTIYFQRTEATDGNV